jgi:hypothetical protein
MPFACPFCLPVLAVPTLHVGADLRLLRNRMASTPSRLQTMHSMTLGSGSEMHVLVNVGGGVRPMCVS